MTEVRVARIEDALALCGLYSELANGRAEAMPADEDVTREFLTEIASIPSRHLLVAEVEEQQIAGTLDLLVVRNVTHQGRPWAIVENMVVSEQYRRRGIGAALIVEALERAKQAHCYKVQLLSAKYRVEAHDFYRSLGFEAVAEGFRFYIEA